MRNLLWRPLVGLTLVTLSCASSVWAQDDDDVYGEKLLPRETRLMFSIPSVPDLVEGWKESSLGEMLADPEFKPFLDEVQAKLEEVSGKLKDEVGITLEDLWNLPQGEITFAVVEQPARKLNAVVLIDFGDNQTTVDTLLEKLDGALSDAGAEHKTEEISEVEVQIFQFPKRDEIPYNTLAYFTDEGYFVAASDVAALKAVLDRWNGDSNETLADNEVFAYVMEKCSTEDNEPTVKWYLDLIGLVKSGVTMVQAQNPQAGMVLGVLPILGLDMLKGMGGGFDVGVADFEGVSKTFIYAEQPPAGVLGLFQFPAEQQTPPKWVSADATMYFGANWNVAEAYLATESLVDSFLGPGATARELDKVATADDGPQVHPKKDLIDNLTGVINLVTMSAAEEDTDTDRLGASVPNMTFALGIKDAAKMKKLLDMASKTDGFPGRVQEIEGQTVYEIPMQGSDQNLLIAVIGQDLAIATTTDGLDAIIAGETDNPLVASEDYQALSKHFPPKTSMITFSQQDTQMKAGYEALRSGVAVDFEGFDLTKLPEFETLMKYARPNASYAVPDKRGALFVGFSLAE